MSTLLVALLLVGFVTIITIFLVRLEKKGKHQFQQLLLHQFSLAGSAHNLSFSAQEFLHKTIIGIDGAQRQLLILRWTDLQSFTTQLIDLSAIRRCTLKKYLTAYPIDPHKKGPEAYATEQVVLLFEPSAGSPVALPFYHRFENQEWELPELESKARHWETMLTKLLGTVQRTG
ncbi:MAG TPA: hypothetical protein VHK91_03620 [Flavisolibacter sp.]|jgi:hypothetical protein|nr:hypothetical protein [Flavisolibacter sp.]